MWLCQNPKTEVTEPLVIVDNPSFYSFLDCGTTAGVSSSYGNELA